MVNVATCMEHLGSKILNGPADSNLQLAPCYSVATVKVSLWLASKSLVGIMRAHAYIYIHIYILDRWIDGWMDRWIDG